MNVVQALQFDPTDPIEIARTHLWRKNPKDAIPLLEKALKKNHRTGEAHHLLGCILIEMGDGKGAVKHLQMALDVNPDNLFARLDLVRASRL